MKKYLRDYFPMLKTREEILGEINQDSHLRSRFGGWPEELRQEFLDTCTGVKGVKLLYDSFFKEVMSPENTPERLEEFLSLLLQTKIRILAVLPNDSTRLADENTLLITDVVVELEDHSIANLEIQKIGLDFPGQRCACYSADLLLRQYKRVRSKQHEGFHFRDIKTVYTIVLFETSPREFHRYPQNYIHRARQIFDTGLELELLQKYVLVPIDIFKEMKQNGFIESKLEAWLTFLCDDRPERILQLLEEYPEFRPMYEQIYAMCCNVEGGINMFSEELRMMDENTVKHMMKRMRREKEEAEVQRQEAEARRREEADRRREAEALVEKQRAYILQLEKERALMQTT